MRTRDGGLVDQVDRLVGQEAVGHVAGRQLGGGLERLVGDLQPVVLLVALRDALAGSRSSPRRSAPRPGPAGSGAPARRPARCTCGTRRAWSRRSSAARRATSAGLRMLAASTAPSAAPAPTSVCSSSMNRTQLPLFLTSSMIFFRRSSNSPRYLVPATSEPMSSVSRRLPMQRLGHVAGDDALGQALDDGRLADARLADQGRVVLGAPREDLDDALDLLARGRSPGRACRRAPRRSGRCPAGRWSGSCWRAAPPAGE